MVHIEVIVPNGHVKMKRMRQNGGMMIGRFTLKLHILVSLFHYTFFNSIILKLLDDFILFTFISHVLAF